MIIAGDIVGLRTTIQKVIQSDLSCQGKSQYLNNLLGRIESYIAIKTSQMNHISVIHTSTQTNIDTLRAQIADFRDRINALGI